MTLRAEQTRLSVLAVTNMYPGAQAPTYGPFVKSQMDSIQRAGLDVRVELIDGRRSTWEYVREVARVRALARSGAYDLVHAHYGLTGFVCVFQSLPLVVSFCGDDLLGTPSARGGLTMKSRLGIRLSHAAARRADAIICKSEEMRSRLPQAQDRVRAHVVPNGVDTVLFSPGNRLEARRSLGLDPRERLVLFPSSPTERRKRLDLAEAAVGSLVAGGVQTRLLVVQGVAPEQMARYYRAADCLLLTSDWEGSPNVVKEALCTDLPVASVRAGDVDRWLQLTPGCELVERDPRAIADGLRRILTSVPAVDGGAVRRELALPTIAAVIIDVYSEAISRRAGGGSSRAQSAA